MEPTLRELSLPPITRNYLSYNKFKNAIILLLKLILYSRLFQNKYQKRGPSRRSPRYLQQSAVTTAQQKPREGYAHKDLLTDTQ